MEKKSLESQVSIVKKQVEKATLLQIWAISSRKGKTTQRVELRAQRADQEPRKMWIREFLPSEVPLVKGKHVSSWISRFSMNQ